MKIKKMSATHRVQNFHSHKAFHNRFMFLLIQNEAALNVRNSVSHRKLYILFHFSHKVNIYVHTQLVIHDTKKRELLAKKKRERKKR